MDLRWGNYVSLVRSRPPAVTGHLYRIAMLSVFACACEHALEVSDGPNCGYYASLGKYAGSEQQSSSSTLCLNDRSPALSPNKLSKEQTR